MEAKEVTVNLEELKEFKKKNAEERLLFMDFLATYRKKRASTEPRKA